MELTTYIFHLKYWKIQLCDFKYKEKKSHFSSAFFFNRSFCQFYTGLPGGLILGFKPSKLLKSHDSKCWKMCIALINSYCSLVSRIFVLKKKKRKRKRCLAKQANTEGLAAGRITCSMYSLLLMF